MGPLRIGSLFGRFAKKDKVESSQFNLSLAGKWPNDFTSEAKLNHLPGKIGIMLQFEPVQI